MLLSIFYENVVTHIVSLRKRQLDEFNSEQLTRRILFKVNNLLNKNNFRIKGSYFRHFPKQNYLYLRY